MDKYIEFQVVHNVLTSAMEADLVSTFKNYQTAAIYFHINIKFHDYRNN